MRISFLAAAVAGLGLVSAASAQTLNVELGVRETGNNVGIGGNGGASGAIELVGGNPGKTLALDGSFQTLTYTFGTDPVRAFTGDGALAGGWATIENLWFIPDADVPADTTISLFLDNFRFFDASEGTTTTLTSFESFDEGVEVMFQEPTFSGSSSGRINAEPDVAEVTTLMASDGDQSYLVEFAYSSSPSGPLFLRLTTFAAPNLPNPAIMIDPGDQLLFDVAGVIPEPTSIGLAGLAGLGLLRRRR